MLLFVLVSAVTQAATALALTEVYLAAPTSVKARAGHGGAALVPVDWHCAVAGLQLCVGAAGCADSGGAAVWVWAHAPTTWACSSSAACCSLLAFFGGFPVGVILYLRNALAVPAAVTEGLTIGRRCGAARCLQRVRRARIFVVLLVAVALLEVVAVLQSPVAMLMRVAPHQEHYLARGIALAGGLCGAYGGGAGGADWADAGVFRPARAQGGAGSRVAVWRTRGVRDARSGASEASRRAGGLCTFGLNEACGAGLRWLLLWRRVLLLAQAPRTRSPRKPCR